MDLLAYLKLQGVEVENALELIERKAKNKSLTGVSFGGKWISLMPPNEQTIQRANEMLASGKPPQSNTDVEFLRDTENGRQFEKSPDVGDKLKKACEKAGGSTTGKKYLGQLARYPGDPLAWVSGRGEVERFCERTGAACEGAVNVKGQERSEPPPQPIPIADKIVHRETTAVFVKEGQKKATVRQYKKKFAEVRDKLVPAWKKK